MNPMPSLLEFDVAPYRLSGVVYGVLLNHGPALQAPGDAVSAAPYKAAPRAPVLYLKPRNTRACHGDRIAAGTIIALGLNYADHLKELSKELTVSIQDEPLVFLKGQGTVARHGVRRMLPSCTMNANWPW